MGTQKPPEPQFVLFNSCGCDLGALSAEELIARLRSGDLEEGDTIKVVIPAEYPDGSNYYPEDEDEPEPDPNPYGQGLDLERTRDGFSEGC
jgi:hypothetical protein